MKTALDAAFLGLKVECVWLKMHGTTAHAWQAITQHGRFSLTSSSSDASRKRPALSGALS